MRASSGYGFPSAHDSFFLGRKRLLRLLWPKIHGRVESPLQRCILFSGRVTVRLMCNKVDGSKVFFDLMIFLSPKLMVYNGSQVAR